MVSGWRRGGVRRLLSTRRQCAHQQVERSPIARQAVKVSALYIYLVQDTSAISGVSCLAPKSMRKTINIKNKFSKNIHVCSDSSCLQNSLVLTITNVLKIFTKCFYKYCETSKRYNPGVWFLCFFGLAKTGYSEYF